MPLGALPLGTGHGIMGGLHKFPSVQHCDVDGHHKRTIRNTGEPTTDSRTRSQVADTLRGRWDGLSYPNPSDSGVLGRIFTSLRASSHERAGLEHQLADVARVM